MRTGVSDTGDHSSCTLPPLDRVTVSIDGVIRPVAARVAARLQTGLVRAAATATVAVLLTAGLTAPAGSHESGPRTAEQAPPAPLAVTVDSMSPSTVPRRGSVTLSGVIRNRSNSTWTDLRAYLFVSDSPMTTAAELQQATATDEALEVGARITTPGSYDEVEDLEPGESTLYRLSIPRRRLPFSDPGVYWLGVHVLGTSNEGRIEGADGRARTFIPLMPPRAEATTMSLVLPLRGPVRRTTEGRVANARGWIRRLDVDGRLGRLNDLAATAFGVPLTWVVDPAVLGAARSLAEGNPAFDLAPTGQEDEEPGGSPTPDSPLTESPGPDGAPEDEPADPEEQLGELTEESQVAEDWLNRFLEQAADQELRMLPYGDVDVATLLRGGFEGTVANSYRLGEETMQELRLDADPVMAPLSGLIPNDALDQLDPNVPLMLSERAVARSRGDAAGNHAAIVRLRQGTEVVLTSDAARIGGPAPTPPFDALALRQRILAEAAVHGLSHGSGQPLVISTPELWDPGRGWRTAAFFRGIDVPWLRHVPLSGAVAITPSERYDDQLTYTRRQRRAELPVANVLATQELGAAGDVLATLLTRNDTIGDQVARAGMLGSSVHARSYADQARTRTRKISQQVHRQLSQVFVEASELVTMSSESGNFSVTVVNNLQEPVTVGLEAQTGSDQLRIRPPDLVSLGPGQRATVRLAVRATDIGVHSVRLVPTTEDGRPLGRSTVIKVRSSQVGLVIWVVMGVGATLFVAAIIARIVRRVRTRKRTHGPRLTDVSS
jgi:hypothetical protein